MGFQYSSNRQDFLLQQIENFFKSLQSLLVNIGNDEGNIPLIYFDGMYKTYFEEHRDFFLQSSPEAIMKHFEDIGFPGGLELVARLLYETGKISEDTDIYFQKSWDLFEQHRQQERSISIENIRIFTLLKELVEPNPR